MLEPTTEDLGIMDAVLRTDGKGLPFLHIKAGGSVCTPSYYSLDNQMHYIYQEGRTVFKYAVSNMADACESIIARNHLSKDNIDWVIPHQANQRIITAVTQRLEVPAEKVMVNIERYGNTSAGTLPLCLWDFEDKLKKGDNLILTAFGAGFAWGAIYIKWGYDGKNRQRLIAIFQIKNPLIYQKPEDFLFGKCGAYGTRTRDPMRDRHVF